MAIKSGLKCIVTYLATHVEARVRVRESRDAFVISAQIASDHKAHSSTNKKLWGSTATHRVETLNQARVEYY